MLAGVGHAGAKGSIIDRLNLAEKFVSEGLVKAVATDPFQHRSLWIDRDEPVQFLSWCHDVAGVLNGKPSSHPVWQDGSVNGLQVISLLLRDEVGGGLTNCVEADIRSVPHDMYQQVAARTLQLLQQEERPDKVAWAKQWIDYGVDRSCVKRCVMIVPYNGTLHAGVTYIREWYDERYLRVGGPWKEPAHPVGYLTTIVWKAIKICTNIIV